MNSLILLLILDEFHKAAENGRTMQYALFTDTLSAHFLKFLFLILSLLCYYDIENKIDFDN